MKLAKTIYQSGDHSWIAISRDPDKPGNIIDTNEYVICSSGRAAMLDPGGVEAFPAVYSALSTILDMQQIEFLFSSHQDPDVISSLPLWLALNPKIKCYVPWVWGEFIPHFGCAEDTLLPIPDTGKEVLLAGSKLHFVPAHYMHSSGNFHVYDPKSRFLFTGDVGAALLPEGAKASLTVENFDKHIPHMQGFHERWMPSNDAKNAWIDTVSQMKIDALCPQHGAIFTGENVGRFLQWFRDLNVGQAAIAANRTAFRGA